MAFPDTPLGAKVELLISGVWTDITADVYTKDRIVIDRGRNEEGARVDPTTCKFTLQNLDGKYSPRNPLSPYYGLIGRNTPVRVSVHAGTPYLGLPAAGARVTTPDTAVLDVTGDIDLRLDLSMDDWGRGQFVELASKWAGTSNQRSWRLTQLTTGLIELQWSPDGTSAAAISLTSTVAPVVPNFGRVALRVVLDVNNGASGKTATFYTAPTSAGPWTQLGDLVATAGTTSIFSSSAPVELGDITAFALTAPIGKLYAFEMRNGIAGTVVANPNFEAQAVGATAFTDGAGRPWTVVSPAELTDRRVRFTGAISSWPPRWGAGGKLVRVGVEGAGIMRRLGQGKPPALSALRRSIPPAAPLAYWPLEDLVNSQQAASGLLGKDPLRLTRGRVAFGGVEGPPGSSPLADFATGGTMTGLVPPSGGVTSWSIEFAAKSNLTYPSGFSAPLAWETSGGIVYWELDFSPVGSGGVYVQWFDAAGNPGGPLNSGVAVNDELWRWIRIDVAQSGANLSLRVYINNVLVINQTIASTTNGDIRKLTINPSSLADSGVPTMGHLTVWSNRPATLDTYAAYGGFPSDLAAARVVRLAAETAIPVVMSHGTDGTMAMGPQLPAATLDLLTAAADADQGILYEARESIALAWRRRVSLYGQTPKLALDYTARHEVAPPLEPTDDDQAVRNYITVTREGGSSAIAADKTSPLSILDPPNGVGTYEGGRTVSLASDALLDNYAGWMLNLGTYDGNRYATVHVDLRKAHHLIDAATSMDVGDRLTIANPPDFLPPDTIDLLSQGYTETIGIFSWDLLFNCTPAGPWDVAVLEDTDKGRLGSSGSTLTAGVTATAGTLPVGTSTGPLWTTDLLDTPFDVRVGGEVMTVTAVTGVVQDRFARTAASGWGTATSGQAWTTTGGSSSDYSVQGV